MIRYNLHFAQHAFTLLFLLNIMLYLFLFVCLFVINNRPKSETILPILCVFGILGSSIDLHIVQILKAWQNLYVLSYLTNCLHPLPRAGRRSWGTIILSRERTERSKTIPLFRKKNKRIEHVLKHIGTICKVMEWKLLEKNV